MIDNNKGYKLFGNAVFIAMSLFCVLPFFLILSASFSDEALLLENGYKFWPQGFNLDAYKAAFAIGTGSLATAYGVTIFVTVVGTFLSVLLTAMLGYAISRRDFKFKSLCSKLLLFSMLFGAGMVPTYIVITRFYHLKDTIWVLFIPGLVGSYNVFVMKAFMLDMSVDLIDAAKIDGAGEFRIFFQIVIPLVKPALAAIALLTAFSLWNDWSTCMLYTDSPELTTLQYYMQRVMSTITFVQENSMAAQMIDLSTLPELSTQHALCVLAAGPMLLVFPFFQKYFVKGMRVGAVKG